MNLIKYIEHLSANKQQTQRYDIALWSKLFYPLACVSMALVALAFSPQQRRHGQLGVRCFPAFAWAWVSISSTACSAIWACCTAGTR
jgi:lipopolysaccharide export LptBFGC system permease protein LptF